MSISVYIIAYNEAKKIADAINSVLWADEIIVADSASTDAGCVVPQHDQSELISGRWTLLQAPQS